MEILKLGNMSPSQPPGRGAQEKKEAHISAKQLKQEQRWAGKNKANLVNAFDLINVLKIHAHRVWTVSWVHQDKMPESSHYFLPQAKHIAKRVFWLKTHDPHIPEISKYL